MEYFDCLKCSGGGGGAKERPPQPNSGIRLSKLTMTLFLIFTQCQDSQKCLQS